jgi:raffinose/stachyose/melibiose transport system permease protein
MFRYTKKTLALEIAVILAALIILLPFWILITTSLKTGDEVLTSAAMAPPAMPTFENFTVLFAVSGSQPSALMSGLLSSIVITATSLLALIALGSLAAYALVRSTSHWSKRAFSLFLIAIILPTQLGTIPLYIGAQTLGLVGSVQGAVLIYTGTLLPLAVFLYGTFFRRLPRDFEEAATIDGASRFQIFVRVVFPLVAPVTGTLAILGGLIIWNDFFTALIFLNGSDFQTLPVVMYNYVGSLVSQWNLIFAVVLISMIPILMFYMFAQKQFIQGFAGGMKG